MLLMHILIKTIKRLLIQYSPLHLVNYSTSIDKQIKWNDLKKNFLNTQKLKLQFLIEHLITIIIGGFVLLINNMKYCQKPKALKSIY